MMMLSEMLEKISNLSNIKNGAINNIRNHRAVSPIGGLSTSFDMLIYEHIHGEVEKLVSPEQNEFMGSPLTTIYLACFTQYTARGLAEKRQVDVAFADFSKGFDKISHPIILEKMRLFDFNGTLVNIFKHYSSGRKQHVQ